MGRGVEEVPSTPGTEAAGEAEGACADDEESVPGETDTKGEAKGEIAGEVRGVCVTEEQELKAKTDASIKNAAP